MAGPLIRQCLLSHISTYPNGNEGGISAESSRHLRVPNFYKYVCAVFESEIFYIFIDFLNSEFIKRISIRWQVPKCTSFLGSH